MTTHEQTIARNVLARLIKQNPAEEWDLSQLTDAELEALINGQPMTSQIRAKMRRIPARPSSVLSYLTDEELENILARNPPLDRIRP